LPQRQLLKELVTNFAYTYIYIFVVCLLNRSSRWSAFLQVLTFLLTSLSKRFFAQGRNRFVGQGHSCCHKDLRWLDDFFCPKYFCPKYFCPKYFCPKYFFPKYFCPKYFCPKYFCPKYFCPKASARTCPFFGSTFVPICFQDFFIRTFFLFLIVLLRMFLYHLVQDFIRILFEIWSKFYLFQMLLTYIHMYILNSCVIMHYNSLLHFLYICGQCLYFLFRSTRTHNSF
jgi:hypothetical protein